MQNHLLELLENSFIQLGLVLAKALGEDHAYALVQAVPGSSPPQHSMPQTSLPSPQPNRVSVEATPVHPSVHRNSIGYHIKMKIKDCPSATNERFLSIMMPSAAGPMASKAACIFARLSSFLLNSLTHLNKALCPQPSSNQSPASRQKRDEFG